MPHTSFLQKFAYSLLRLGLLLSFCLLPGWGQAAEFSATVVKRTNGGEVQGRIFVKGDKVRREVSTSRGLTITILRPDKQLIWMVLPAQKAYMELPNLAEITGELQQFSQDRAGMRSLGTETVNGYQCDKYETSFKTNGGSIKHFMWVARKLGMPLRITSPDGVLLTEYREIKEGGVPEALFELPAGYQNLGGGALRQK